MLLALSKCLFKWMKWINRIISKSVHAISKILLIFGLFMFLACLECISRNGLPFGHSDWDPSTLFQIFSWFGEVLIKNYFVTDAFPASNVWRNPRLNLKYLAPSPQVQFRLVALMKILMAFRFWPKVIAKPAAKRKILSWMLMRKSHVKIWMIAGQFSAY